ncbi:MAG: CARDB domain-containing protein [Candidatus Bilamarchaeaceae archaeon]
MKRLFLFLLFVSFAFSQTAQIINSSLAVQNVSVADVYNDGTYMYIDNVGNPDFGIKLCGVGQKYIGATYAANVGGTYRYYLVSWNLTNGAALSLVYTSLNDGGGCYYTPLDAFAFSQFKDFAKTPPVFVSAFPGRIHVLYSDNGDGSSPSFVFLNYSDGWLGGSYTVPLNTSSFNQLTGNVTATVTSINMIRSTGESVSISPSDSKSGLNSSVGRSILIALCSDDYGASCSDAVLVNSSAQLPVQLSLNMPTSDQVVYRRYVVVNGLGYGPICIGADITPTVSVNPSSIYPNNSTNVTITLTNTGNVNITTNFRLTLNISGPTGFINQTNWTITEDFGPGASIQRSINFSNTSRSGTYIFTAIVDPLDQIVECNENRTATNTLTVIKTYQIHVFIDGIENDTFEYAGRAYNVTMYVNDSDGNIINDATFELKEINGLNPFTPAQVYNDGSYNHSVKSYSIGVVHSNSTGQVILAVIPTCNKFYNDPVKGPILEKNIGNYSIEVRAYGTGFDITKTLNVTDRSCADPGWINNKQIVNKDYVEGIYDWLYEVFTILKKLLVP